MKQTGQIWPNRADMTILAQEIHVAVPFAHFCQGIDMLPPVGTEIKCGRCFHKKEENQTIANWQTHCKHSRKFEANMWS